MASIYRILKEEHRQVKKGLNNILRKKEDNFIEISEMLKMHMEGEEEQVYPALKEFPTLKNMVTEALEEHRHAKMINEELMDKSLEDEDFMPKLKVLKEMIEHHIEDEEEELFPKAQKVISKEMDKDMAQSYEDFKEMAMK